jgi:hypothetical protein
MLGEGRALQKKKRDLERERERGGAVNKTCFN